MSIVSKWIAVSTFAFVAVVFATNGQGQTPIAGDDFDGGANNGGLTASSVALYEGDFDTATFESHDNTFNGLFDFGTGSRFDRFGYVNATVMDGASFAGSEEGLPFDHVDDSLNGFDIDRLGIVSGGVDDTAFGLADTLNGQNIGDSHDGTVSAEWTFDITGGTNLRMSIDFAAIGEFNNNDGEFETDDYMTFSYSIDGGDVHTIFDVRAQETETGEDTGEFYTVTMDGGMTFDRYFSPFFSGDDWDLLINSGPNSRFDFHPEDTDMDGFLQLDGAFGVENVRAMMDGTFLETELESFENPLYVNDTVSLNNSFQTVSAPIDGTGSTLTLKMLAVADGSLEFSAFDNILIEEVVPTADLDGDGDVDGNDFLLIQKSNPELIGLWEETYGSGPGGIISAVPEPSTVCLLGLLLTLSGAVRRR